MKTFEDSEGKSYTFSSCRTCEAECCNGAKNSTFAQIVLEDFKEVYENFPILFIFGDLGYLKPVVLLSNSTTHCPYIKDMKCTIYDKRPSICRLYPISPHILNKPFIDTSCPAVNSKEGGDLIIKEGVVNIDFHHPILDDYQDRYIKTHDYFKNYNQGNNFSLVVNINGLHFFRFKEDFNDPFIKKHISSLEHLKSSYFSNFFR